MGLRLLDDVTYGDRPVTGDRTLALLATLAAAGGRPVPETTLVQALWGDGPAPAHPGKALQVVVSRTRAQTAPDVVQRTDGGYRLGPATTDVAGQATALAAAERAEGTGDTATARDRAREALAVPVVPGGVEPLAALRAAATGRAERAGAVLGRALAALGDHDDALVHLLAVPDPDETTLAALLRSEAAVHGAPVALERYERHRAAVRDRLGVDHGPLLQAVHAELLAADNPVRTGVRYDATSMVGRADDLRALRALLRRSRVVSILGPGGLGKTSLAQVLAREAEQPVVHVVELVGVVSPDDVVGEVGSALGVRDSVSGRRVLTPEQRADVRARMAAQLDRAPTLLVLDNCEHVVDAVADLVATLVATTRTLRVLTTTRAPLAIAAEQVFALDQLDDDAAAELFVQRARAARPAVHLDDAVVRRVVARLDGLPLAVELAAARVRAMSVADLDRRLDDRFALLRGTDRGRPDRHQTLLAVIDWSWNLLGEADRAALRRLSVLADGFALDAAEAVVGPDAFSAVETLVGQSLLVVRDAAGEGDGDGDGVRYRMLETVRELGRLRLREAGDEDDARSALRRWAVARAEEARLRLHGPDQVAAVRGLGGEENNLADVLRQALAEPDPPAVAVLVAALASSWTIRGEHDRVVALAAAVGEALSGWTPPAGPLADAAARAAATVVVNTAVSGVPTPPALLAVLTTCGPASTEPEVRALAVLTADGTSLLGGDRLDLGRFVDHPDRHVAGLALRWSSHALENSGELAAAVTASERALGLWRPEDGPWPHAMHHTQLAGLHSQLGDPDAADRHAAQALDVLDDLLAVDDAVQLRAVLATGAIARGDLDEAQRQVDEAASRPQSALWGGGFVLAATRAELALARGDVETGLALYEQSVAAAAALAFPGLGTEVGLEPWTLYAESSALASHARHGADGSGVELHAHVVDQARRALAPGRGRVDHPAIGCLLFALGVWALLREGRPAAAVELVALAERFGYSRHTPSMALGTLETEAEAAAPGALEARRAAYDGRSGPDLLAEARAAVSAEAGSGAATG